MQIPYEEELCALADAVWETPEPGFREYKSSAAHVEFLKKHGFISEKKVTAVMCKEGILLLPVEKKSKISGKVLDGIENAADQLEVCAGCEEIIHDELTQKQITGEEGSIDKLMSIAQDLLSQQTEINKRLIFLMDVKKKAQKSPSEETARSRPCGAVRQGDGT